jgi:ParB family chromosome partitioning protein
VKIKRRGKKGRVEIEFYDDQDLDRLLTLLKPG